MTQIEAEVETRIEEAYSNILDQLQEAQRQIVDTTKTKAREAREARQATKTKHKQKTEFKAEEQTAAVQEALLIERQEAERQLKQAEDEAEAREAEL